MKTALKKAFPYSLIAIIVLFSGCAPSHYLNKAYDRSVKGEYSLALFPFYGELPLQPDTGLVTIFQDASNKRQLVFPSVIRNEIDSNAKSRRVIQTVLSKDYSNAEKRKDINVKELIGKDGLAEFRAICKNADFALMPIQFFVGPYLGRLMGVTKFRLFDLTTGQLVYEADRNVNTDLGYPGVDKRLTLEMMVLAHSDFEKYFLKISH